MFRSICILIPHTQTDRGRVKESGGRRGREGDSEEGLARVGGLGV